MDIAQLYEDLSAMGRKMMQNETEAWVLVKVQPDAPPILPETEKLLRLHWQELKAYAVRSQGSTLSSSKPSESTVKGKFYQSTRSNTLRQIVPKEKEVPELEMAMPPPKVAPAIQTKLDFGIAPQAETTWETDSAAKVKKSSTKKRTLLVRDEEPQYAGLTIDKEVTPEMLAKIIRLRDSHRLVGPDHWFVRDWATSLKRDASSMIDRASVVIKMKEILTLFGDCIYLAYVDSMYEALSKTHPDRYRNWIKTDAFEALKGNFKELNMVCGTVNIYALPKDRETFVEGDVQIETKWAWMEAPDGGIVDPAYRVWPFGIFNYRKEVTML